MNRPKQFNAFTVKSNGGLLRTLQTNCHACAAFDPAVVAEKDRPPLFEFIAIWDTGASGSAVTQDVVDRCGLKPIGITQVHGVHGMQQVPQFLVNLGLPNGVGVIGIKATLGQLRGAHILIGMDVISRGDFSITNVRGNTTFSFRIPSVSTVDYVKEHAKTRPLPGSGGNPPRNFGRGKGRRRR